MSSKSDNYYYTESEEWLFNEGHILGTPRDGHIFETFKMDPNTRATQIDDGFISSEL